MNEKLMKPMREILLKCYGVDIDEAKCHYSTQNYAFIFPEKPYMIRVSMTPKKTRKEILSELLWVDDLKQFKQTICEPSVSLNGNLLEEFEIDAVIYRASMFRTARGNVQTMAKMDPMFFICVGELLGKIHYVSTNERELGMRLPLLSIIVMTVVNIILDILMVTVFDLGMFYGEEDQSALKDTLKNTLKLGLIINCFVAILLLLGAPMFVKKRFPKTLEDFMRMKEGFCTNPKDRLEISILRNSHYSRISQ